jgi:HSP20 family protein
VNAVIGVYVELHCTSNTVSDPSPSQIDVKENDSSFELAADVPGMSKDAVKVELSPDNKTLFISAEKHNEAKDSGERDGWKYHREERSSEHRSRAVRLPPSVDPSLVSARVTDGVLHVTMPKRPGGTSESQERKLIPIA